MAANTLPQGRLAGKKRLYGVGRVENDVPWHWNVFSKL
jgi:hypothetical protein